MAGTIFLLGATGFLGSTLLISLGKNLPQYHVVALARGSSPASLEERTKTLKTYHPNLSVVEGTIEDELVVKRESAKADIVINCANSLDIGLVKGILNTLEERLTKTDTSPIFIQVSGLSLISDDARGQAPNPSTSKVFTDIGFSPNDCSDRNPGREVDNYIIETGSKTRNGIRTLIFYPGWIYGLGEAIGLQRTSVALRIYTGLAKQFGYTARWSLQAALDGRAELGTEGIYFGSSEQPPVPHIKIANKIGNILHEHGLVSAPGSQPLKREHVSTLPDALWLGLGGNLLANPQRLKTLGWEPIESRKISLLDSLPEKMEVVIKE